MVHFFLKKSFKFSENVGNVRFLFSARDLLTKMENDQMRDCLFYSIFLEFCEKVTY